MDLRNERPSDRIGGVGLAALAKGLKGSQITTLELGFNNVGAEGVEAFFKACCQCAEQGRFVSIEGVVFTEEQEDEIKVTCDAALKKTAASIKPRDLELKPKQPKKSKAQYYGSAPDASPDAPRMNY